MMMITTSFSLFATFALRLVSILFPLKKTLVNLPVNGLPHVSNRSFFNLFILTRGYIKCSY
jgi:hypothetical protein